MKYGLTAAALALAMGFSGAASAQSSQVNGLYFEAKINFARATDNGFKYRDQGLGLGLGYNLDQTFAIEGGYDSLGKDQGVKLRGIYAGLVASYQLTPELVGKLKAGVINVEAKAGGAKEDKNRLYLGAGLEYPIAPQLSLTGDYRYTKVEDTKIHTLSVGSKYAF
jgi:opacity protein-like surface antigen